MFDVTRIAEPFYAEHSKRGKRLENILSRGMPTIATLFANVNVAAL